MSEVELKLNSSVEKNDIHLIATEQHQSLLNNGMPAPPPVPIPYRGNEKSINIYSCRGENLKCVALSGLDERLNEWRGKKNLSINFSCDDLVMIFVLGRACSNCCYCELVNRFFFGEGSDEAAPWGSRGRKKREGTSGV